ITLGIAGGGYPGHPGILVQDFERGIRRIARALTKFHFAGEFLYWNREYPKGCPRHDQVPFAFKPFCFGEARKQGHRFILWMDTSVNIKRSLDPLFEVIQTTGYLLFPGWHTVGEYCKDTALISLGITRDQSFTLRS